MSNLVLINKLNTLKIYYIYNKFYFLSFKSNILCNVKYFFNVNNVFYLFLFNGLSFVYFNIFLNRLGLNKKLRKFYYVFI